jgi:hypothetical protein
MIVYLSLATVEVQVFNLEFRSAIDAFISVSFLVFALMKSVLVVRSVYASANY